MVTIDTQPISCSFEEWMASLSNAFAHIDGELTHEQPASMPGASAPAQLTPAQLAMLGIPEAQLTPEVTLAVTALLERLDDVNRELSRTKQQLAELERLVDVDMVAPIPNRRAFMRRLAWALTMHERYAHPSTILYFDLNGFKAINDTHGHAAGDVAIRHAAQLLANAMRESDFLARIGGDEFAVIMYYAEEEAALKRAAKIADKLAATPLIFNGKRLQLSTAFGCYRLQSGDDAESALASADMSMYMDKRRAKSALTSDT